MTSSENCYREQLANVFLFLRFCNNGHGQAEMTIWGEGGRMGNIMHSQLERREIEGSPKRSFTRLRSENLFNLRAFAHQRRSDQKKKRSAVMKMMESNGQSTSGILASAMMYWSCYVSASQREKYQSVRLQMINAYLLCVCSHRFRHGSKSTGINVHSYATCPNRKYNSSFKKNAKQNCLRSRFNDFLV